jgi:hypothetical protein
MREWGQQENHSLETFITVILQNQAHGSVRSRAPPIFIHHGEMRDKKKAGDSGKGILFRRVRFCVAADSVL